MDEPRTPFSELGTADLLIDRVYEGGTSKTFADDPIGALVPVGNQGGFRYKGSVTDGTVKLIVLYTTGGEPDWPDQLDPVTGDFIYYGDNRKPGFELHKTARRGNLLLRDIFEATHGDPESRKKVPPILLFEKSGTGRDVKFRGLLAPGSHRLNPDEELVGIWRTTVDVRFQNYRAHFTVLKTEAVTREWLNEILAGNTMGESCPAVWEAWVRGRIYEALEAPRTTQVRSRTLQSPLPEDMWIITMIHDHFSSQPVKFEHLAAALWVNSDRRVSHVEVTRPSVDGGRDAVGTFSIGPKSDPIPLEFALEAKCYAADNSVGVKEVSRLISRIRHRQFGVLITTSYVGTQAYREVREDMHPIVFVTGRDIVDVIKNMGYTTPAALKKYLEAEYALDGADAELSREPGSEQSGAEPDINFDAGAQVEITTTTRPAFG